ncbi:GNAT superfamily N-acetyltransferase [Rhizobium aethiopicum]|uniref:GNAT superfamily N-acetyltransferase n=1 Tax=Rhizobium aethiopicum TaxID=1138170 RepID=A0A7W6Q6N8_9HYPH|nr:GNAT superfamily N-acetyltransferase [Rhizobium aethiopicum]MBB4580542.1 GNAT superfamily N-acetyltransferase [Rhizobium aethiopicum]
MTIDIRIFRDRLPEAMTGLAHDARQEGHLHIGRLIDEWAAGDIRFARDGERLLGAFAGETLVGVGGMTIEPAMPEALRMRRFYVRPAMRGRGVGRMLALALLDHARRFCRCVTVHAGNDGAAKFWESLEFRPLDQDGYTHVLDLRG